MNYQWLGLWRQLLPMNRGGESSLPSSSPRSSNSLGEATSVGAQRFSIEDGFGNAVAGQAYAGQNHAGQSHRNVQSEHYGARGDGKADDGAAIQRAIDDCQQVGGGVVFLPTGTYLIKRTLLLRDGVNLVGAGMFGTILKLDGGVNAPVISDACAIGKKEYAAGRVHLANFRIDGNKSQNPQGGAGIFTTAYYSLFENLYISNCRTHGLQFGSAKMKNNSSQNRVVGCRIFDCEGSGVFLDIKAVDYTITQNYIYHCDTGLTVRNGGIRIINNAIYRHRQAAIQVAQTTFSVLIANNDINANLGHGIHITRTRSTESGPWSQMLINGNIILGDALSKDNIYAGIYAESSVDAGISQLTITGNKIYSVSERKRYRYGINLQSNVVDSKCADNHIFNVVSGTYHVGSTCRRVEIDRLGRPAVSSPPVPESTVALINPFHAPVTIYVSGGEVAQIDIDDEPTGVRGGNIRLQAGQSITLRYKDAPNWRWFVE